MAFLDTRSEFVLNPSVLRDFLSDRLLRATDASQRETDGSGKSVTIAELCANDIGLCIAEIFGSLETLPPTILSHDHRRFDIFLCRLFEINPDISAAYSFEGAIRRTIAVVSEKVYYEHPDVQKWLRKTAEVNEGKALDQVQEILGHAKEAFGLHTLQIAEALTGGLSGARVLRVYYGPKNQQAELGVFKTTDDHEQFERECSGHEAAHKSWMANWIEPTINKAELANETHVVDKYVILTPLAFPPAGGKQIIPSLHDLITERADRGRCFDVVQNIGQAYAKQYESISQETIEYRSCKDVFHRVLKHWASPYETGIWHDEAFWLVEGLPPPSCQCIQDGSTVCWNPLWLIEHGVFGTGNMEARFADQHGDLNARNVMLPLVPPASGSSDCLFRLIDFEKWDCQSAILDPCWLSLHILKATAPSAVSIEFWSALPHRFYSAAFNGNEMDQGDSGAFQLGIELVSRLFEPFHEMGQRAGPTVKDGLFRMLSVTLAAATLAFAYYEVRRLSRRSGIPQSDATRKYCRLWGLFGLRVASKCLSSFEEGQLQIPQASVERMLSSICGN